MKNKFLNAIGFALVVMMLVACRSENPLISTGSLPPLVATATRLPPTMPLATTQKPTVTPLSPTPTATLTPNPALKLIYVDHNNLRVLNLGTGETFPLVMTNEKIVEWYLSPDVRSLIYQLQIVPDAPPDKMIFLLDLPTKEVRGPIPNLLPPVWHPSGEAILGYNLNIGQYDLYRLDDGVIVGNLPYGTFSPDGTQFAAFIGQELRIYQIILDTDGQVDGIDRNYSEFDLNLGENIDPGAILWSPAGDKLVFGASHRLDYPNSYLFIVNPDSGELFQLAESTQLEPGTLLNIYSLGVINFSWSPDGSKIAFIAYTFLPEEKYRTNPQVYLASADGTHTIRISEDSLFPVDSAPLWTPDGQLILGSTAFNSSSYPLVMLNLENGERKVLIDNVPSYYYLSFLTPQEEDNLAGIIEEPFVFTCSTGWSHLEIGMDVIVAPGSPNRVRSEPMKGNNIISKIPAGTVVRVIEGPVCADGLVFWKVESESMTGCPGWTAEGDGVEYWLSPLE